MVKWVLPAVFVSLWLADAWAATESATDAIIDSTPSSRAEIQHAVATALGTEVLIAEDALTISSLLIIDRRPQHTIDGRIGGGRVLDPPETFQLVLDENQCILVHRRTGEAYPLENARCRVPPSIPRSAPLSNQNR